MTAIWSETSSGWGVLQPAGFPDEKTLRELVAQTPELLPLSGAPRLVVLGREVRLGSGRVDVLAIEPSGRPVVIEVKLRNNTESRRAVVAQVLAYAAALYGSTAEGFESDVLATQLAGRGLHDVVREAVQTEVPDAAAFHATLDAALADGAMRVVLVLDRAPQELIRLVGYLEAVTHGLVIDLITVASYELEGRRFVVPQRVEPERIVREAPPAPDGTPAAPVVRSGELVVGHEAFLERIESAPAEHRPRLDLFARWAERLSAAGLADTNTWYAATVTSCCCPISDRTRPGWCRCTCAPTAARRCSGGGRCSNGAPRAASVPWPPRAGPRSGADARPRCRPGGAGRGVRRVCRGVQVNDAPAVAPPCGFGRPGEAISLDDGPVTCAAVRAALAALDLPATRPPSSRRLSKRWQSSRSNAAAPPSS